MLTKTKPKPKPSSKLKLIALLLFVLILFVTLAGGIAGYLWYQDGISNPAGEPGSHIMVEVQEGDNLLSIAPQLADAGLIRNLEAFRIYNRLNSPEVNLMVGVYKIPTGLNIQELLLELEKGPVLESVSVTLPEAIRMDEMAEIIDRRYATLTKSVFSKTDYLQIVNNPDASSFTPAVQEFLNMYKPAGKSLEGFLFPDTYVLAADASAKDIIELQILTLIRRLAENSISPQQSGRLKSFYEVLTLATITEREANNLVDKKIVSDIFLRRMESGQVLGADAPLLYPLKDWRYELTFKEIEDLSNPYNMRRLLGLPPTPIANPGINSIISVLQPTPNDYFFFVSADGVNYYARTMFEHCNNIRIYLGGSC